MIKELLTIILKYINGNCIFCNKYIHQIYSLCDDCSSLCTKFIPNNICIFCNIEKPCICNVEYRILYTYNSIISKVILDMKYNNDINFSIFFAKQMAQYVNNKSSILISIPTTIKRLRNRGYNQSVEICKHINNMCKIPHYYDVLQKNRNTEQKNKNKQERLLNSTSINLFNYHKIIDQDIIIVDDVIASGATIQRCINLLSPYAKSIMIFAVAKT